MPIRTVSSCRNRFFAKGDCLHDHAFSDPLILWKFLLAVAMLVPAVRALAADPSNSDDANAASATNASSGIDFFAAIRNGDLDVKFIPRDFKASSGSDQE